MGARSVSLQGALIPQEPNDYSYRKEALIAFQDGATFTHLLHGVETPCSIWDFAAGDMVKVRYDELTQLAFYRVTASDLSRYGGKG